MPSNQRRGIARKSPSASHGRDTSSLQELLRELAFILVSRGISLKGFSELSRSAFVQAAAGLSRLQNGRVNYSRVAAVTGLRRADVKRLLENQRNDALAVNQTAVERVLNGWRHDPRFSRAGKAGLLKIVGSTTSFNSLAKKYGGDVPYRAVLTELERIGAVTIDRDYVRLRPTAYLRKRHDLGPFSAALPALIDGLKIAAATRKPDIATSIHRVLLPVDSDLHLAFVRERCISTVKTMLDGLSHSLGAKAQPRSATRRNAAFAVTVLMVERSATKDTQQRRRRNRSAHGE